MKKILKYLFIGLTVYALLCTIIILRSCDVSNELARAEGRLQAHKEETEKGKKILMEEKEILESETVKKDEEIFLIKTEIEKSRKKRIGYEKTERENVQEIKRLKEEAKTLTDEGSIIVNLKDQVTVLEKSNKNKDKIIFEADKNIRGWASAYFKAEAKYKGERAFRIKVEGQLAKEERRGKIAEGVIKQAKRDIAGLKIKITFKNVIVTGLAFAGGYWLGGKK